MGLKRVDIITCDGGCETKEEIIPNAGQVPTIKQVQVQMENALIWSGMLCKKCTDDRRKAILMALPKVQ